MIIMETRWYERIQARRVALGMSVRELAKRSRLSRQAIMDIEAGLRDESRGSTLSRLGEALGLSVAQIRGEPPEEIAAERIDLAHEIAGLVPVGELPALRAHVRVWANLPDEDRWKLTQVGKVWAGDVLILGKAERKRPNIRPLKVAEDKEEYEAEEG
jgi:transcriptional regulator with XRE-family HTH domain